MSDTFNGGTVCSPYSLSGSPVTQSSSNRGRQLSHTWHQLAVRVEEASLQYSAGSLTGLRDPKTYVEIFVDGKKSRQTEVVKGFPHPKYSEDFSILVTPHSRVEFQVKSRGTFTKDTLFGRGHIDIYGLLKEDGGCVEKHLVNLTLTRDDVEDQQSKTVGEIQLVLDGLRVSIESMRPGHFHRNGSAVATDASPSTPPSATGSTPNSPPAKLPGTAPSPPSFSNKPAVKPRRPPLPKSKSTTTPTSSNVSAAHRSSISVTLSDEESSVAAAAPVASNVTVINSAESDDGSEALGAAGGSSLSTQSSLTSASPAIPQPSSRSGKKGVPNVKPKTPTPNSRFANGSSPANRAEDDTQPLPPNWEIRTDKRGRRYYVDHNTKSTSWERPMPLPSGWDIGIDTRGRTYYVDHNTKTTTWQRPSAESLRTYEQWQGERSRVRSEANRRFLYSENTFPGGNTASGTTEEAGTSDDGLGPLPEGWERRLQAGGRVYFVNHKNKTTQWEDPRTQGLDTSSADPMAYERNFKWSHNLFRYLCQSNMLPGLVRIVVARQLLFEQSFHQIMRLEAYQLRRRLYVTFKGEEGLDYGGIAREWFFLLSHEVLNPMYCLFEYANPEHTLLQINPASSINPDHLVYFQFIGRFIAMALYHRNFIYSGFTLPFYKQMLGKKLMLKDLESVDPEFYQSLRWILDNNIAECDLEMYFTADFECLGKVTQHDLKPDGANIRVNEENKEEYVQLMMEWRMTRGKESQTKAFLDGFNEVVPLEWLKYFDERELQLLLCGMQEIDVEDWRRNTILRHYSETSKQVLWFWQFVKELDNEKRARLLQFVTGSCQVPYGGFAMLMGSNSLQRFCIERVGKETWLPRSHTCFNRLDLPPYKSYEQLKEKLLFAIEQTEGFWQE